MLFVARMQCSVFPRSGPKPILSLTQVRIVFGIRPQASSMERFVHESASSPKPNDGSHLPLANLFRKVLHRHCWIRAATTMGNITVPFFVLPRGIYNYYLPYCPSIGESISIVSFALLISASILSAFSTCLTFLYALLTLISPVLSFALTSSGAFFAIFSQFARLCRARLRLALRALS